MLLVSMYYFFCSNKVESSPCIFNMCLSLAGEVEKTEAEMPLRRPVNLWTKLKVAFAIFSQYTFLLEFLSIIFAGISF